MLRKISIAVLLVVFATTSLGTVAKEKKGESTPASSKSTTKSDGKNKAKTKTKTKTNAKANDSAKGKVAQSTPPGILFRHALSGESAATLVGLVTRYNEENKGVPIVLQHISMTDNLRFLPHIALLEQNESSKFFDTLPRMVPLFKVMADASEKFDATSFYPVIADVVDDSKGKIQALPLAQSIPVLFYNKDALRKAGADPDTPPKTWLDLQVMAGKLYDAGYTCPYASSNTQWVHIENLATQQNAPLINSERGKSKLAVNGLIEVKHIALLSSWYKSRYFHYFGRGREADEKFVSGECSMLTSDSALYAQLSRDKKFNVGVAALPYYDDVYGATPGRVLPDGAVLRVVAGKKPAEYKRVANFVSFLLRSDVQKEWVKATGYLPMTPDAVDALVAEGVEPEVLRKVSASLANKTLVSAARPKMFLGMDRFHAILGEELEAVWADKKPAKEALDNAVIRGNAVLRPAPK